MTSTELRAVLYECLWSNRHGKQKSKGMGTASESGGPVPYLVDPSSILVPPIDEHELHGA